MLHPELTMELETTGFGAKKNAWKDDLFRKLIWFNRNLQFVSIILPPKLCSPVFTLFGTNILENKPQTTDKYVLKLKSETENIWNDTEMVLILC